MNSGECELNNWYYSSVLQATIEVTKHALLRMTQRGIGYLEIEEALKHGYQKPGTNKRKYREITVAAERKEKTYTIFTVW